jgi:ABC-type metal ion transport system substrate-binding protein
MIKNKIDLVSDCDIYIINNNDALGTTFIPKEEKIIEKTCNSIITNIIVDYKNEQQRKRIESNTFCCP